MYVLQTKDMITALEVRHQNKLCMTFSKNESYKLILLN